MTEYEVVDVVCGLMDKAIISDTDFNETALMLFAYQYKNNLPFQQFCRQRGKTPRTVKKWNEIPPVTINAFKELTLSCKVPDGSERIFMTSGTTQGIQGKHYHPTMAVYDRSMITNFKKRFMHGIDKMHMGILFPTEEDMPNSSLAHYLALAVQEFGTMESTYFISRRGVETENLLLALDQSEKSGEPFALLGASYSFVHLLEELEQKGISFSLPSGSRILDTGGFKNQSREMDLNEFYDGLSQGFGIDRKDCVNMYGMTELSTQFYDNGNAVVPSEKSGPDWIRTRVINPVTGQDVPKGETGILVHCDLANFNSVTTILTEDLGIETNAGFLLLGRAKGAEAKGCSLAVEEFVRHAKR